MTEKTINNPDQQPIVSLLMTGSELMSGDTIDSNSAFIARSLLDIGLQVHEMATVGDDRAQLTAQIRRLAGISRLLIMNGGLGPTQDDLTAEVLASVAGKRVTTHAAARQHVLDWCKKRGFEANQANLKQAELPEGSQIFPDAPGSAPAFYLFIGSCLVIATPGVPRELKSILHGQMLPFLRRHFCMASLISWRKLQLIGIGESRLQEILDTHCQGIGSVLDIGFRARFPTLELKYKPQPGISLDDPVYLEWENRLLGHTTDYLLGTGDAQLPALLVEVLSREGKTVTCAESCTGGLIASEITRIPGASAVFPGGIISYANAIKQQVLQVPTQTLEEHGAVSRQTVLAMLKGVLALMQADYGVAISGIAGPGGGTAEKPVGTVWIAWGEAAAQHSVKLLIPMERTHFQSLATTISLDLLRRFASGDRTVPNYLSRWQGPGTD